MISGGNQQGHVSMATFAARRLQPMIGNVAHILAIEWLCAAQGVDFLRPLRSSPALETAYGLLRAVAHSMPTDRHIAPDIEAACALVHQRALTGLLFALPAGDAQTELPPLWVVA